MKVDRIYIATHRHDLPFTRICVASVRQWYPEIPILLIKDECQGKFSTQEIEDLWNVGIFKTERKIFGWGFSKLEPVFAAKKGEHFLVLDSDIVFLGKVLERVSTSEADFIVQKEVQKLQSVNEIYFSLPGLEKFDPNFKYPNFTFNSGQVFASGGLVQRDDFAGLIDWSGKYPILVHPQIFKNGDQGVLNYLLMKKMAAQELTVGGVDFMKWPGGDGDDISGIDVSKLNETSPYPFLLHWAGLKKPKMKDMVRSDILSYFENCYYSRVPFAFGKKKIRAMDELLQKVAKKF